MDDVNSMTLVAIGRKYGVPDNAVRKWIRWYEAVREDSGVLPLPLPEPAEEPEADAA